MVRLQITNTAEQPRTASAEQIKAVAVRLFSERGVDGVTVREIATAAGQKNHGAVGYYFGSKEALVREIVLDGAIALDQRRNALLDAIEASGEAVTIRKIVDVLIFPVIETGDDNPYVNFIVMLSMTHRDMMMSAIDPQWNRAYQRCLDHLRRLMPDMPESLKNQRMVFMNASIGSVMAGRQRALSDHARAHHIWDAAHTLEHFAQTITAMIAAPLELDPAMLADVRRDTSGVALAAQGPMG